MYRVHCGLLVSLQHYMLPLHPLKVAHTRYTIPSIINSFIEYAVLYYSKLLR